MKKLHVLVAVLWIGLSIHAQQTNVLLIIADDLGIESLSVFNDDPAASLPPTPTIDGLAAGGVVFNRFYGYSNCSPTRGSIMSGRYGFRTGITSPMLNELQPNEYTLPEALIDSGVISNRLACIGKWHLGGDADAPNTIGGWPHFSGALGGALGDFYSWPKVVNGSQSTSTDYATTDNVDDGIAWINQQGTNSWFLWVAFNAPHTPHHRPPNDLHDYDTISDDGGNDSREHFEAMVQAMDTEIARLLAGVDLAKTTVIFMGDNGTIRQVVQPPIPDNHAKNTIYEGGLRIPLVVAGAAVDSGMVGTSHNGALHTVDLYATILELFGVEAATAVPEELVLDSRSFAPLLGGQPYARVPADVALGSVFGNSDTTASVEGDYKYILTATGGEEFYNVGVDLPEANNLLAGTLDPAEQAIYESLTNKVSTYINVPHCYSAYMDGSDKFNIEIGWFANSGFTLHRSDNLASNNWTSVAGQEFEDNGTAALILRDPSPPATNAYYRVTTP